MLAPPATTPDDEDGAVATAVIQVATHYTTRADGQMDFAGFTQLVGDLLCLRDDVPHAAPERTQQVAIALAAHVRMVDGQQSPTIDLMLIVDLVSRWPELMGRPDVQAAGGERLPSPAAPGLLEQLDALRERRDAADRESDAPMWVYMHEKCRGAPVGESILRGEDGWRFVEHGDGTGIVYFWPPDDAPDREAMLRGGIHALPVARLGTAAAPVPAQATLGTLPLHEGPAISTPRLRRVESPATLTMLRQSSEKAAAHEAQAATRAQEAAAVSAALKQQAERAAAEAAAAAQAAAQTLPASSSAAAASTTSSSSSPSPSQSAPAPPPPPPLTAEEAAEMVDARLLSLRLRPVDVGGGGNCFFRSLACAHTRPPASALPCKRACTHLPARLLPLHHPHTATSSGGGAIASTRARRYSPPGTTTAHRSPLSAASA